jgi:short-subunit dehydrogenase involved in D-alanine esterification of teichoic acids
VELQTPTLCPTIYLCAKFTALKKAVEEITALRYHLRSMGIKVSKITPIYVDNMSVVLNASNSGNGAYFYELQSY